MDDGDAAIFIEMEETLGVDTLFPTACSNDTEEAAEVVGEIEQKLNNVPLESFDSIICRVPTLMFNENPEAYIPHMVSIGPIHHDQKHLQPMETHKMLYFKKFLRRSSPKKLKEYVKVMTDLAERAHKCYPGVKIERKSLIMMMVVDGCFILELLHNRQILRYLDDDEKCWVYHVLLDLILVENQLPFFVLEELCRVFIGKSDGAADTELHCIIYDSLVRWAIEGLIGSDYHQPTGSASPRNRIPLMGKPKHLLAFVREFLILSLPSVSHNFQINYENENQNLMGHDCALARFLQLCINEDDNLVKSMRCATDLKNANVKFEKSRNPTSLLDINFDYAKGVLTIPSISVDGASELIIRNLMAYEFYSTDYPYVTEYVMFLSALISSGKDVKLLQESEILPAGDPSELAKVVNSLNKYAVSYVTFTRIVSPNLMMYYNRRWNKWKASLMLNYCNTPWALLSVVAAIILLVLTIIQTIFTVLSYH